MVSNTQGVSPIMFGNFTLKSHFNIGVCHVCTLCINVLQVLYVFFSCRLVRCVMHTRCIYV